MMRINKEKEMFRAENALPKDWNFVLKKEEEKKEEKVQVRIKCKEEWKRMALIRSTLTGEYSMLQLKRFTISNFNLAKNSSLYFVCMKTNTKIETDNQLKEIIAKIPFFSPKHPLLQLQVCMFQKADPCFLCLSEDCCHLNPSVSAHSKKRKDKDQHNTLIPDILTPVLDKKNNSNNNLNKINSEDSKVQKKRKISHITIPPINMGNVRVEIDISSF